MRNRTVLAAVGATALTTAALWSAPHDAAACGGFFCNRQAIDQSGERILYAYNEDGTITTVVQIFYSGPSESFAWILPVPAEPTVEVGTDALFTALEGATAPRFELEYQQVGTCRSDPACSWWGPEEDFSRGGGPPPMAAADAGASAPDVDVRLRANVGPYEVAVLAAGSGDALRTWLADNEFDIPEAAGAELDHYVALNHFFVALKLLKDRSAGEIQPIVLRSANDEPCIPIRLTRIATVPDMPVTAYFLADHRARPSNYMLVTPDLDDTRLWWGGRTYSEAVTQAVDDLGGHAFTTDYSGSVPSLSIEMEPIEDMRSVTDPAEFLRQLQARGFTGDSQLLGLLLRFIPPLDGWEAQTFYNCIVQGWCSDPAVDAHLASLEFDPSAFVDALNEAIIDPRREAQAMLDSHAHLTRLFTTLSAEEMTEDPEFVLSTDLAQEVSNVHRATLRTECGPDYFAWTAPQSLILPSGRTEVVREGVAYHGTDDEYCEDVGDGFYPGTPVERLREIARSRSVRPGGGGLCSIGARGAAGGAVLVLAALALAWRRRR